MNLKEFLWKAAGAEKKQALPILSFPAAQKLGVSVEAMVQSSELQAQAMQVIAEQTDTLAAVSLMDLSVEAEAFGATVRFSDHEVPAIVGQLVSDMEEAEALEVPDLSAGRALVCTEGIRKAKERIRNKPVLAGMIGPFSLAGRLMDVTEIMYACYDDPDVVHVVLDKAAAYLIRYGRALREAGADGIVLAEPLSGLLSPDLAEEFSIPYVTRIIEALQTEEFALIYHNCGNSVSSMLPQIYSQGAAAYHFGNAVDLRKILEQTPSDIIVMGNIDPAGQFMRGTPASIKEATRYLLQDLKARPNFIPSSGCDIPAPSSWENIQVFFSALNDDPENEALVRTALQAGADNACVIRSEDIVTSATFRDICAKNTCGAYDRCWVCPPAIGGIDELIARIRSYPYGLLYQTICKIEDSFDIEGMGAGSNRHHDVSYKLEKMLRPQMPDILHLSCGGCHLCEQCTKPEGLPCRHPDKALPSMEGYGIDVYQTARPTPLRYNNGQNTVTFFGIVLF